MWKAASFRGRSSAAKPRCVIYCYMVNGGKFCGQHTFHPGLLGSRPVQCTLQSTELQTNRACSVCCSIVTDNCILTHSYLMLVKRNHKQITSYGKTMKFYLRDAFRSYIIVLQLANIFVMKVVSIET